jgi:hypothetical protein
VKNKATKFPLPEPIELAKLAATFAQGLGANTDREVRSALTKALQFYLEAVFFHREQSPKSLKNLINEFGSKKLFETQFVRSIRKSAQRKPAPTLEHDPEKGWSDDPVRQHLDRHGLRFKTSKSLLNHIRRKWERLKVSWRASLSEISITDFLDSADQFIEKSKRTRNGKEVYNLPMPVLDQIIELRRESKRRSQHKSREKQRKKSRQTKTSVQSSAR